VTVHHEDGAATFAVDSLEQVDKVQLPYDRIWSDTTEPVLRLITCGGSFDRSTGNYRDNVIAYAHLVQARARARIVQEEGGSRKATIVRPGGEWPGSSLVGAFFAITLIRPAIRGIAVATPTTLPRFPGHRYRKRKENSLPSVRCRRRPGWRCASAT